MTTAVTAPASTSSGILAALGTGSGIDTVSLTTQLVAVNRATRDKALLRQTTANTAEVSALAQVQSGLATFASALDRIGGSGYLGLQASSSDPTTVSVTGDPKIADAKPLNATIAVQALASAQTLVSGDYASADAAVGQGTLTLTFGKLTSDAGGHPTAFAPGSAAAKSITITAANDSLSGLADAINAANSGVTASIVNDGTGYRLALTGATGTGQAFTLSAATTPGSTAGDTALAVLDFAPGSAGLTSVAVAGNARATLNGVAIERSTNSFTDLLPGYTVNLIQTTFGTPATLSAARDPSLLTSAVNGFVTAYNSLQGLLATDIKPGASGSPSGPLYGETTIHTLANQLSRLTSTPYPNGLGTISLADIGIKTAQDGTISVDATRLQAAIAADPASIEKLFTPGQAASTTTATVTNRIGTAAPGQYAVANVVPGGAARLTGASAASAFAAPIAIDSSNSAFTAALDGLTPLSLAIPSGSYANGTALATAFQNAINGAPAVANALAGATVTWVGDHFVFQSNTAGSASAIGLSALDPTLAATLGLNATTSAAGTDASGTINGLAAVGHGNTLAGAANTPSAGLSVSVGAATPTSFSVSVGQGLIGALDALQTQATASSGVFANLSQRLTSQATAFATQATKIDADSAAYAATLTTQFTAAETAITAYKSIGSFLTDQIAQWNNVNNKY